MDNQIYTTDSHPYHNAPEDSVNRLHQATERLAKRKSCWYGFFYGIAFALGASIGASVIMAVIYFILQKLQLMSFIDTEKIQNLIELLQENSSYLEKK